MYIRGGMFCRSIFLSIFLSIYLSIYVSIYRSIYLSPIYLAVSLSLSSVYLTIYLSMYLSICLSIYLSIYLSVCLSVYLPVYLQAWKPTYSARRPQVLNLTTSKTQQFCVTSSFFKVENIKDEVILRDFLTFFEVDNIKNETILRDFFIFWTWQHPKRSNSARLLQFLNLTTSKTKQFCETSSIFDLDNINKPSNSARLPKVECRAGGLVPMRCAIFSTPPV